MLNSIHNMQMSQPLKDQAGISTFTHGLRKNILFEQKKIKLQNTWNFVENKTDIMQHVLKIQ